MKQIKPIHPGEILVEEFLLPMKISQYRLAKSLRVSPRRINEIVHGTSGITANTALRLAKFFGSTPEFWLNLQSHYNLELEQEKIGLKLDQEIHAFA